MVKCLNESKEKKQGRGRMESSSGNKLILYEDGNKLKPVVYMLSRKFISKNDRKLSIQAKIYYFSLIWTIHIQQFILNNSFNCFCVPWDAYISNVFVATASIHHSAVSSKVHVGATHRFSLAVTAADKTKISKHIECHVYKTEGVKGGGTKETTLQ